MSHIEQEYQLGRQYQLKRQSEADEHRIAMHVVRAKSSNRSIRLARIYKPALYRLGKGLESFGNMLQIRYGNLKPRTTD